VYQKTAHPDIVLSTNEDSVVGGDLEGTLRALRSLAASGSASEIIALLQAAIPGAAISEAPAPDITAIV